MQYHIYNGRILPNSVKEIALPYNSFREYLHYFYKGAILFYVYRLLVKNRTKINCKVLSNYVVISAAETSTHIGCN